VLQAVCPDHFQARAVVQCVLRSLQGRAHKASKDAESAEGEYAVLAESARGGYLAEEETE